jgi:hypothetical protein
MPAESTTEAENEKRLFACPFGCPFGCGGFGELADLRDETLRIDALVAAACSAIGRMSNV